MSKTLSIKGAPYPPNLGDLAEVCIELGDKVFAPFYKGLPTERQNAISPQQSVYPMGDTIHFDTQQYELEEVKQLIPRVITFLDLLNIAAGDPKPLASGISFPILHNPHVYQGAPSVNLSERSAGVIFRIILGLQLDESGMTELSVEELLEAFGNPEFERLVAECTFDETMDVHKNVVVIQGALTERQIIDRMMKIQEIALWAIVNGFETVQIA